MCCDAKIPPLELVLFVRTRWASMFTCLNRAIKLQEVCTYTVWRDNILIESDSHTGNNAFYIPCRWEWCCPQAPQQEVQLVQTVETWMGLGQITAQSDAGSSSLCHYACSTLSLWIWLPTIGAGNSTTIILEISRASCLAHNSGSRILATDLGEYGQYTKVRWTRGCDSWWLGEC